MNNSVVGSTHLNINRSVRLAMLYGSETWCLRENEMAVFMKDQESKFGESNVPYKTDGEKENRGTDGDVRIGGNSSSDGKGKWSEMVPPYVEER